MSAPASIQDVVAASAWSDGSEHSEAGELILRAVDEMHGVEPEMLGWFFANLDRERYFDFHPQDHYEFAWTRGKQPGEYVGATHLTHQRYGGASSPLMRAEISFVPVPDWEPDPDQVGFVLSGIIHPVDDDGPAEDPSGRFVHVGMRCPYGTELRSCWWLRPVPADEEEAATAARLRHVHEEFGYLNDFLPDLYAREATRS